MILTNVENNGQKRFLERAGMIPHIPPDIKSLLTPL